MKNTKQLNADFRKLINEHQGIILKISSIYAKSNEERKDLYQEILLQLWRSYPSFKNQSLFSTWMYRVALNTAISMTKKTSLFINKPNTIEQSYNIDDSMNYSEDVKILYQVISQLKPLEKAIILLWLEERTYEEIAETTGITVKNVSVRLVRIKSKLTELIKKMQ